MSVLHLAEM